MGFKELVDPPNSAQVDIPEFLSRTSRPCRLEQLLGWILPSYHAHGAGVGTDDDTSPSSTARQAALLFLPPGVKQRVIRIEKVEALLSVLMQLRDCGVRVVAADGEPAIPVLPLRVLGEGATHTVSPLDRDSGGFTLYNNLSFSTVAGVSNHFVANAASLPGVDPAHQDLLSQKPVGPAQCKRSGGWLFGAVSHGLPPSAHAYGDSGIGALLSLPLLSESDTDGLDLISRATTARASPAHQPSALRFERSLWGGMGLGGSLPDPHGVLDNGFEAAAHQAETAAAHAHATSTGKQQTQGRRNLWKELFENASNDTNGCNGAATGDESASPPHAAGWQGGNLGNDWWEQCAEGGGSRGGTVPRPVSECGVEEFERFARWMEDRTSNEYAQSALVSHEHLVRDLVFLSLGLASQSFELHTGSLAADVGDEAAEAVFRVRADMRWKGVGVSPLRSLFVDMCVAGSHVYRLGLFIRRNRYGCGKVMGSFCGTLADYLQHYRRQILSLLPAGT